MEQKRQNSVGVLSSHQSSQPLQQRQHTITNTHHINYGNQAIADKRRLVGINLLITEKELHSSIHVYHKFQNPGLSQN